MGKIRRLLKHVTVEAAKGNRRCRRDGKHTIHAGRPCLVIRDEATLYTTSYCAECALLILKQCAHELRTIRDALYSDGVPQAESAIQSAVVSKRRVTLTPQGLKVEMYDAPANSQSQSE